MSGLKPRVSVAALMFASALAVAQPQTQPQPQAPSPPQAQPGATEQAVSRVQPAAAAVPFSPLSAAKAAQIQTINENMTLLAAQLSELEMQAKIAAKQKEIAGNKGGNFSPLGTATGTPSVISVAGLKGKLEALLAFPGGLEQRVRAGDVIGDRRVQTIALNEVVLTDLKGANPQRLAFGNSPLATREGSIGMPGGGSVPMPFNAGGNIPGIR